jgi:hypothetical protein
VRKFIEHIDEWVEEKNRIQTTESIDNDRPSVMQMDDQIDLRVPLYQPPEIERANNNQE